MNIQWQEIKINNYAFIVCKSYEEMNDSNSQHEMKSSFSSKIQVYRKTYKNESAFSPLRDSLGGSFLCTYN